MPAFATPRGDGRIVHGTAHGEVGNHVPIEGSEGLAQAAPFALQFGLVVDVIEQREPMARWRF